MMATNRRKTTTDFPAEPEAPSSGFGGGTNFSDPPRYEEPPNERWKWLRRSIAIAALTVIGSFFWIELFVGKNDIHTWQVLQYPNGSVEIRNRPGWYTRWFARVTTYPRMITVYGTKSSLPGSTQDDSVKAWFNDGGTADISWVVRVTTPCPTPEDEADPAKLAAALKQQREFHRQFMGNVENARNAVRSAVRNVIQQTGPIMSSTENQSAKKGEFWQAIFQQLNEGLFEMKPVVLKTDTGVSHMLKALEKKDAEQKQGEDALKPKGTKVASGVLEEHAITVSETVVAAEIVKDANGKPVVATASPLEQYGMDVLQLSILDTDYDTETLQKFGAKKKLFLAAEESKAATIQNVQQRFQRVAQGDREVAEEQWIAEKARAEQRIKAEATQEREVIVKETLRTKAETLALVEAVNKEEQELLKEIALVGAQIAGNEKKAAETLAEAREREIEIAGAISDHEKGLAQIMVTGAEQIAEAMKNLKVPDTVIMSPDAIDPTKGTALQQALPSMQMLKLFGLLDGNHDFKVPPKAKGKEVLTSTQASAETVVK